MSDSPTRPPGFGSRPGESEGEGLAELPSLAPWEPPARLSEPEEGSLPMLLAVQEAQAASSEAERAVWAERINHQLDTLTAGSEGRQVADVLHQLLEGGQLAGLEEATGRTCRAAATEALLRLGFPFALEVRPEDLEHLRGQDTDAPGRYPWAPWAAASTQGVGLLAQWAELPGGPLLPEGDEPVLPLVLLMGLALLSLVPALLGPERSDSRRAGLLGLLILALIQLYLGLFGGYYGTFSGGAALLAWLLLVLPRR